MSAEPWPSRKLDHVHERLRAAEAVSKRRRFEDLLERHEARLRRVAFGVLGDANRVDDVLQEALLKAYRALPARFESDGHEAAWLYRIVHRCCLNELRAGGAGAETPRRARHRAQATDEPTLASLAVAAALAELPPDARAVVLLVDLIGLDYETAATRAADTPRDGRVAVEHRARAPARCVRVAGRGRRCLNDSTSSKGRPRPRERTSTRELWERIDARERASRRRRRAFAAVAVAAALVTVSAAGVFAYGEQTTPARPDAFVPGARAGRRERALPDGARQGAADGTTARSRSRARRSRSSRAANPVTQLQYVGVTSVQRRLSTSTRACATPRRAIPLARAGLPAGGRLHGLRQARASTGSAGSRRRSSIRMHVTLGRSGAPVAARIAIRSGAKQHPVAYIDWTPTRITAYVSPSCQVR